MPLSLDGTGSITGIVTVSVSDDLAHVGDTNTKISFPANDTISFDTSGNERIRITSAGSVGINQDNPNALLSLGAGVNAIKLLLYDNEDNNKYGFGIQANELRQFYPDDSILVFGTISRSDGSTFSEKLRITSGGNVGVGTNNPAARLHVQGNTEVKDARGNQNFIVSESGFRFNQSVNNWSSLDYTPSPVLAWDYKSGPGDLFYIGSGGNTPIADQMAIVVSDAHGIKIGRSGYDGTDYDISSSNEFFRVAINGSVRAGNNASFSAHTAADDLVVGSTSGSNGLTILTGSATGNIFFNDGSGNDGVVQYVHSTTPNYMRIASSGWIRLSAGGNNHGGGIFCREKTCTTSGTQIFSFSCPHGALAGTLYAICSNNGNSVSKIYQFCGKHGNRTFTLVTDSGAYAGKNFSVTCTSAGNLHTFACTTSGANAEISFTFHMGAPNQDITYTEL